MKIAICDFELRTLELIKNFVADTDTLGDQPFKILSYENPFVSAKYCYATHELRLHQNDRCKRFTLV